MLLRLAGLATLAAGAHGQEHEPQAQGCVFGNVMDAMGRDGAPMALLEVCREQVGDLGVQVEPSCENESGPVCHFSELVNCLVNPHGNDPPCTPELTEMLTTDCAHVAEMHLQMHCDEDGMGPAAEPQGMGPAAEPHHDPCDNNPCEDWLVCYAQDGTATCVDSICACYLDEWEHDMFCEKPNLPYFSEEGGGESCECMGLDYSADPPVPMPNYLGPVCPGPGMGPAAEPHDHGMGPAAEPQDYCPDSFEGEAACVDAGCMYTPEDTAQGTPPMCEEYPAAEP